MQQQWCGTMMEFLFFSSVFIHQHVSAVWFPSIYLDTLHFKVFLSAVLHFRALLTGLFLNHILPQLNSDQESGRGGRKKNCMMSHCPEAGNSHERCTNLTTSIKSPTFGSNQSQVWSRDGPALAGARCLSLWCESSSNVTSGIKVVELYCLLKWFPNNWQDVLKGQFTQNWYFNHLLLSTFRM